MTSPDAAGVHAGYFLANSLFVGAAALLLIWVSWQSYRRQHLHFLRLWAAGWLSYVGGRVLTLLGQTSWVAESDVPVQLAVSTGAQAAYYLHAALLLVGLVGLVGERRVALRGRSWLAIGAVVLAFTGAVGFLTLRTEPEVSVFLRVGLRCVVTGLLFVVCGGLLLRHGVGIRRVGAGFVGVALLAGGVSYALQGHAAATGELREFVAYLGGFEILTVCAIGFGLVLWMHEDVNADTARIHAELAARTAALLQAQRLESIGQLAGGVAHDFNNVLTVVRANTEALLRHPALDGATRASLEETMQATRHASKMTGQLLGLAREPASPLQPVDVAREARAVLPLLRSLAGPRIRVALTAPDEPLLASLRSGHVEQILVNLVTNGRDAIVDAGTIALEVYREVADGAPRVVLSAADSGQGIPAEVRGQVGELFFTTKQGHGTGVGLASVRSILARTSGEMAIASAEGRGTTVRVCWPEAVAGVAAASAPAAEVAAWPRAATILFAEDDPMVRLVTQRTLERAGYHVLLPASSREALEVAKEHSGPIHLLLSDVVMPGLSGPQLAGAVQALRPDTAVRFVSGFIDDERGAQLPAGTAVLAKPFTGDELLRFVQSALDTGAAGAPS